MLLLLAAAACSSSPPAPTAGTAPRSPPPAAPAPPAPAEAPPAPPSLPVHPPWAAFTGLLADDHDGACVLTVLRVAPAGVEPLRTVGILPGACGKDVDVVVAPDGHRLGVVYGTPPAVAWVEDGTTHLAPPLPRRAATTRFRGGELRAFGVYDDVPVEVDDPPDDVPSYVVTINGRTYHGWMTGDANGGTPCGEWRLVDGAWVHEADGIAGADQDEGSACPDIDGAGAGVALTLEFPYDGGGGYGVGRAPFYRGKLHGGGTFVITSEWYGGGVEPAPSGELQVFVDGAPPVPGGADAAEPEGEPILVSLGMTGNQLVAFDLPLACSTQLGGAVIGFVGPTAADAVRPIWEGRHCIRRWPDALPLPAPAVVAAAVAPAVVPAVAPAVDPPGTPTAAAPAP